MAAPLMEMELQTSRMTVDIASQPRLRSKKNQPAGLGLTEGWGFLRTKYRGGLKKNKKAPSSIGLKNQNHKKNTWKRFKNKCPFS